MPTSKIRSLILEKIPVTYRALIKDTLIYGVANSLGRFFTIAITPLLTRIFLPAEYGVLDAVIVTATLIQTLMSLNLESSIFRFYYEKPDQVSKKNFVSTIIFFVILSSLVIVVSTIWSASAISQSLFETRQYTSVITIATIAAAVQIINLLLLWVLRLERRLGWYVLSTTISIVTQFGFILYFILYLERGIEGYFLGFLVAQVIQCVITVWVVRNYFSFHLDFSDLNRSLKFSLPILPTVFIAALINSGGRYFLLYFSDLQQVGLFGVAFKASSLLVLLFTPFQMAWQPFSMANMHRDDANTIYSQVTRYFVIVFSLVIFGMIFFSQEIILFFAGEEYLASSAMLRLLTIGTFLGQLVVFFSLSLIIHEKSKYFLYAYLLALTVFLIFGFLLVPQFSGVGASIIFILANLTMIISIYLFAQRLNPIRFPVKMIALLIGTAFGLTLVLDNLDLGLLARGSGFLVFIALFSSILLIRRRTESF